MTETQIVLETDSAGAKLTLRGAVSILHVTELHQKLRQSLASAEVTLDLSGVTRIDTAAAWAIAEAEKSAEAMQRPLRMTGATPHAMSLLATVRKALPKPDLVQAAPLTWAGRITAFGQAVAAGFAFVADLIAYFGLFLVRLVQSLRHPRDFRLTALVHHCQEVGVKAVPIVALMSFLIGIVLAFQGSTQLRQFGAEVFVVDLIAVSILRELGILLTAIIVAGRTASAFTAAIGSMKMREEIDAMRTLGIDPAAALFVPRILALFLMLPILGLLANLSGLIGGALMSWIDLGISPMMFKTRLIEGTDISHLMVGMIKAPAFALIIGVVGCHAGMQVGNNAESLGQKTSAAVVTAIFAVIVADAVFSIFFAKVGL